MSFPRPPVRWVIAAILFLETLLAYVDMQELAVLAPHLKTQLGVGNIEYGYITQAFLVAYTITFLFGGLLIDRWGVRRGLAVALAWWSVANMLHGFAQNPMELAICRFLLGIAYPGAFLAAARVVSEWYPPHERGLVYGIYVSGATFGAIIAYPLVTWMTVVWDWRGPFLVTGAAGLLLVGVWLFIYRSPETHPWVSEEERRYVLDHRPKEVEVPSAPFPVLFRSRTFWAVGVGRFIADNTWVFYAMWLSKFLSEGHGLSLTEVGAIGWIPFLFADVGSIAGGWLSGRFIKQGWSPVQARMTILLAVAAVRAFSFILGFQYPLPVLIGLLSLFMMCTTAWQVNLNVMIVDKFPSRVVATAAGLTTSLGTFSSVFFTRAVAHMVENYSYRPVFVLLSILSVAGVVAVIAILGKDSLPFRRARQPVMATASVKSS